MSDRTKSPRVPLGLGSAQFGMDYGISNGQGRVSSAEVAQILDAATQNGIQVLDTAYLYGRSEAVLGQILGTNHPFRIVTKTTKVTNARVTARDIDDLRQAFEESLARLQTSSVAGLLVHDADDLAKPGAELFVELLHELKRDGQVQKIGVSVYEASQLDAIAGVMEPDLMQLPLNVLDQRLIGSGHLSRLARLGVEIHARSAFLQGLLLMDPDALDPFFDTIKDRLRKYHKAIRQVDLEPVAAALNFVRSQPNVDTVVVGVCSARELTEIVRCGSGRKSGLPWQEFAIDDATFVNPSHWRLSWPVGV